jgi:hypothetical protein
MNAPRGNRGIVPLILNLDARRGVCVGNATPRSIYPWEREPVPTEYELGEHPLRTGRVQIISFPQGYNPRIFQPEASRYTDYDNPANIQRSGSRDPLIFNLDTR